MREAWTEKGAALGKHRDAAPPTPLERLHDACVDLVSRSARYEQILVWVDFDERGLLAHCASAHASCSDPCWEGTSLRSITFGP